jgi:hypothetical protein
MSEPQRDVQQVVTLLREIVSRQGLGYSERFEADAELFYIEAHLIAPGKSIPAAMNAGSDYERRREEKWEEWTKARATAWFGAMADAAELLQDQLEPTDWRARFASLKKHSCPSCDLTDEEYARIDGWNAAIDAVLTAPDVQKAGE